MALIDNLISYWKLDEASGNALDAHGSNDLTETSGTIGTATGKINGARDFEAGDTEWFEHSDNADLSTGDINFSISCWVRLESGGAIRCVACKGDASFGSGEWQLTYNNVSGFFVFSILKSPGTQIDAIANSVSVSTATWYHITAGHSASGNIVWICVNDGTLHTTAHSGGVNDSTLGFTMGKTLNAANWYWDGLIDEFGFWKKQLSSTEITQLYNGGNGLAYPFSNIAATVRPNAMVRGIGI